MKYSDIAAISEIANNAGAIHIVDNTLLTPYYQLPLELGADVSVHSTTKYMDGHNATVGGAAISKTNDMPRRFASSRTALAASCRHRSRG